MLTAAQVGAMLGLSPRKVYDMARSGEIQCYRFGDAVRFEPADVEAYKASCRVVVRDPGRIDAQKCSELLRILGADFRASGRVPHGVTELDRAFAKIGVKPRKSRPTKAVPYSRKR